MCIKLKHKFKMCAGIDPCIHPGYPGGQTPKHVVIPTDRQLFIFTPTWVVDSNPGSVLTTVPTCYHYAEIYILIK